MNLDWNLIAAFLAVLRHGSLSAAARALGLTQPTLRGRIAALEAATGQTLFLRGYTGLAPTPEALALRSEAEAMEAAHHAFLRRASAGQGIEGRVRITASEIVATERLPYLLAPLVARHPGLRVEVAATDRVGDLPRLEADLAVRHVAPTTAALVARKIPAIPLGLYAAQAYLDRRGMPRDWSDIAKSHVVVGGDRTDRLGGWLAEAGLASPRHRGWRSDSDVAQLGAVRAGVGIGVVQRPLAERFGLVPVVPDLTGALPVWLVMHEDLRRRPAIRAVSDALAEAFARPMGPDEGAGVR
ncbi:LysR family transcriptional regulator [Jannaschia sp. KMU-145]|uniref:LysR family transcriptional regulator n=1 Tax=Jannaschia halovivens TaxID=3388667 RepID=UPI00396B21C7